MKNITITVDERAANWARVHAAERNISLSRLIGEMLEERMRRSTEYEQAMRAFFARPPVRLKHSGERYPSRDELHDRDALR